MKRKKKDKKSNVNEYVFTISGDKKPNFNKKEINFRKYGKFKLNFERKFVGFFLDDKNNPDIKHKSGMYKYVWKISYEEIKKEEEKLPVTTEITFEKKKKKKEKKEE